MRLDTLQNCAAVTTVRAFGISALMSAAAALVLVFIWACKSAERVKYSTVATAAVSGLAL